MSFESTTLGKTAKAALYIAISAALAYLLSIAQNDPSMWGVYTPIINILLVLIKNHLDPNTPDFVTPTPPPAAPKTSV